jgi:D-alanine-D-alanine ligase
MSKTKQRVGVLFGGRSGEHEVSLRSANSVIQAIDRELFEIVPIGIAKSGHWLGTADARALLAGTNQPIQIEASASAEMIPQSSALAAAIDVIFPVLHGTFGEDGTIQGLLELADIPYVGSGVLGSAAGMDKDIMKRLFAAAGLPQTPHITLLRSHWRTNPAHAIKTIEAALRYPLFVKPANLGSSVGISKVKQPADLARALDLAASFDRKIIIEQGVGGPGAKPRELEVAILGNDAPKASVVGEIVPAKEFYDYEAKYELAGPDESLCIIPADITSAQQSAIQSMALTAFHACDGAGLARVDFLMEPASVGPSPGIFLNEINTMPGFTSISMYPKLWQASGVPYRDLITRLIHLALERHEEKQQTAFSKD